MLLTYVCIDLRSQCFNIIVSRYEAVIIHYANVMHSTEAEQSDPMFDIGASILDMKIISMNNEWSTVPCMLAS